MKDEETERKRVVMCDYDVNNIGFYLPDGSYEAMFDPEQDFARLIREHISVAAEISFRKLFEQYICKEDLEANSCWIIESVTGAYDSIDDIRGLLCCDEPDSGSIKNVLEKIEEELASIEAAISLRRVLSSIK